jgi:hypothetical protein
VVGADAVRSTLQQPCRELHGVVQSDSSSVAGAALGSAGQHLSRSSGKQATTNSRAVCCVMDRDVPFSSIGLTRLHSPPRLLTPRLIGAQETRDARDPVVPVSFVR